MPVTLQEYLSALNDAVEATKPRKVKLDEFLTELGGYFDGMPGYVGLKNVMWRVAGDEAFVSVDVVFEDAQAEIDVAYSRFIDPPEGWLKPDVTAALALIAEETRNEELKTAACAAELTQ